MTLQHEEIVNATGPLRKAAAGFDEALTKEHLETLLALLIPHTEQEEFGIFDELKNRAEFAEHIKTLCAEHDQLHALFGRISEGDFGQVPIAIAALREHIEKEENGLFPAAAVEIEGTVWQELAERSSASVHLANRRLTSP